MILCLLLASLLLHGPAPQSPTASIAGTVVSAADNRPLARVRVTLSWRVSSTSSQTVETLETNTGDNGRFTFPRLDARSYQLDVGKDGYVRQSFGQRTLRGKGAEIDLAAGEQRNDIIFRLTPTGVITGKVRDDRGEPVAGLPVELRRPVYDADGVRTLKVEYTTRTDDRGDYRLHGITPGRYYLLTGLMAGFGLLQREFEISYFPGDSHAEPETPLEVRAGSELFAEIGVTRARRYSIKGHVALQEQDPITVFAWAMSAHVAPGANLGVCPYQSENRTFQCSDLIPGPHILQATFGPVGKPRSSVTRKVIIDSESVEGVELSPGAALLSGRVFLDGKDLPETGRLGMVLAGEHEPRRVTDFHKARFEYPDLGLGVYTIRFPQSSLLAPGSYVSEIRFNGGLVVGNTISFSGAAGDRLEIFLSSKGGRIQGQVRDERLVPVNGASVVLMPANRSPSLYRSVSANKDGRFALTGIAPGNYDLCSWEGLDEYEYFDPAFLERWRGCGTAVYVRESSSEMRNLQVLR